MDEDVVFDGAFDEDWGYAAFSDRSKIEVPVVFVDLLARSKIEVFVVCVSGVDDEDDAVVLVVVFIKPELLFAMVRSTMLVMFKFVEVFSNGDGFVLVVEALLVVLSVWLTGAKLVEEPVDACVVELPKVFVCVLSKMEAAQLR